MRVKHLIPAVLAFWGVAAQATVLRVSNVGASAPYSTINAAVNAATEGDTIIVDGTSIDYDAAELNKRIVLIGPGYWLRENGIATETSQAATINSIKVSAEGCVITGVFVATDIVVGGSKTVISRCRINGNVSIEDNVNYCVVRQNYLNGEVTSGYGQSFYHQITNNIFGNVGCKGLHESYIAYNTSINYWGESFWNSYNCRVEKNIMFGSEFSQNTDNTYGDNYIVGETYKDIQTDKDVRDFPLPEAAAGYGAFAGDSPYVVSGIPAGPVIEELIIPTSVEEGSTMEVTLKLGANK